MAAEKKGSNWAPRLSKDKETEWETKSKQMGGAKGKMKKKGGKKRGY